MTDYTADAEALFRDFAGRHSFAIEKLDETGFELLMRIHRQPGISFDLTLGLQNDDELNIGIEDFWSFFFPYETVRQTVSDALDALATGDGRVATYWQRRCAFKHVLEQRTNGRWRRVYTAYSFIRIPFLRTVVTYLNNEDVRPRG